MASLAGSGVILGLNPVKSSGNGVWGLEYNMKQAWRTTQKVTDSANGVLVCSKK